MANVTVDAALAASTGRGLRALVFVSNQVGYAFFIDGDNDFVYSKTTDGGASWGTPVQIGPDDTDLAFDVWYDRWTPGDTGDYIHMVWFGSGADDIFYRKLDVHGSPSDTLGPTVIVEAETSAVAGIGTHCSITKGRGGKLYISWECDASAERGFERSTDGGTTWTAATAPQEATGDWSVLYPANLADANDIWAVYFDASTNELTVKTYDDSGDSWAESSVLAKVTENTTDLTGQMPFSASVRHSDGHLIISAVTERLGSPSGFDDHRVFDFDSNGAVEKDRIANDTQNHYYNSVFIDQDTGDIYIAYSGKRDGSEVLGTSTGLYYVKSTNGGATWSSGDTPLSESNAAFLQVWTPLMGDRFIAASRVGTTLISNKVNSVDLAEWMLLDSYSVTPQLTITAGGDASASLTGVSSTGSAGTFTVTGGASVSLTGVSSSTAVGTLTAEATGDATAELTGVSATGSVGTLTVAGDASVELVGVSAAGGVGNINAGEWLLLELYSVTPQLIISDEGGVSVGLTGVSAFGAVGSFTVTGDASVALTGVSASGAVGILTAEGTEGNATVELTGVFATGSVGTLTVRQLEVTQRAPWGGAMMLYGSFAGRSATADATASLTGVEASGAVGTFTITAGATVELTGVSASGAVGEVGAGTLTVVDITGVQASGEVGTLSVAAGAEVSLTGVSSTGAVGELAVTGDATVELTGVSASGQFGTLTATAGNDVSVELTGLQATGAVGTLAVSADATVELTGVQAAGAVGTVTVVNPDVTVQLTGVQATGFIGTLRVARKRVRIRKSNMVKNRIVVGKGRKGTITSSGGLV